MTDHDHPVLRFTDYCEYHDEDREALIAEINKALERIPTSLLPAVLPPLVEHASRRPHGGRPDAG